MTVLFNTKFSYLSNISIGDCLDQMCSSCTSAEREKDHLVNNVSSLYMYYFVTTAPIIYGYLTIR